MQQMTKVLLNQIIYSVPKKSKPKCICNKCSAIFKLLSIHQSAYFKITLI